MSFSVSIFFFERKTSPTALLFLRSYLQPLFLLASSGNNLGLGTAPWSGTALMHASTLLHSFQLHQTERRLGLPWGS